MKAGVKILCENCGFKWHIGDMKTKSVCYSRGGARRFVKAQGVVVKCKNCKAVDGLTILGG